MEKHTLDVEERVLQAKELELLGSHGYNAIRVSNVYWLVYRGLRDLVGENVADVWRGTDVGSACPRSGSRTPAIDLLSPRPHPRCDLKDTNERSHGSHTDLSLAPMNRPVGVPH